MKKRKLNSKNPLYGASDKKKEVKIKEKILLKNKDGVKIYSIKYE
tara:strand:+ start:2048 stop:2182 length:135 start_codon:yes stop_codon:yes gene_type:complete